MSNSTTLLDTIASNQAAKEVVVNALFDAASPSMIWGRHASACSGLTWGFYGGQYGANAIANGTVTLTASTTNYVYADNSTGAVSVNTTGVPTGKIPLYTVVTGTTTVTSYTDLRSYAPTSQLGGGGGSGTVTSVSLTLPSFLSVSGSPVTTSGTFTVTLATQAANAVFAGPASGSAAAPTFRALVGADIPVFVASGSSHAPGGVPDPGATAGSTKFLREDGTWNVPAGGGGSSTLAALTDVNVTPGAGIDGYSLTYNNATSKWVATNISGGGSGSSITGTAGSGSGAGGTASATGGVGGATGNGGQVTVTGGAGGSTSGAGGAVTVKGGTAATQGNGGNLTLAGGDGASTSSGNGGNVVINGGQALSTQSAGNVTITGGAVGFGTVGGGKITITGGGNLGLGSVNLSTADSAVTAAPLNLNTGQGIATGILGGIINIAPGASSNAVGAPVNINGGNVGSGNNDGGAIVLTGGTPSGTGARGNIVLNGSGAALATTANGGFVNVPTCAGAPTGTPSTIPTGTVPIVFDTTNVKLMAYTGGSWQQVVPSGGGSSGPNITAQSSTYSASANDFVCTDTSGGSFSVNLPASPTAGQQVWVADSKGTWPVNPIRVFPNGGNIFGMSQIQYFYKSGTLTFTYENSTVGWVCSGQDVAPVLDEGQAALQIYPGLGTYLNGRGFRQTYNNMTNCAAISPSARSRGSGRLYFEFTFGIINGQNPAIGVAPPSMALTTLPGGTTGTFAVIPHPGSNQAQINTSGGFIVQAASGVNFANGDICGFAIDFSGTITVYKNNTQIMQATGQTIPTVSICAGAAGNTGATQGYFSTRAGHCTYSPPSGYSYWDN